MGGGLVYIINKEVMKQRSNIKAVGMDLDGNLTNLHTPEIYGLMWESILEFLPADLRKQLQRYTFEEIGKNGDFPIGWFLDMHLGYLVLADPDGRILSVKKGNAPVTQREKIYKAYGRDRTISLSQPLNADHVRPRFLPYGDGFDYVEGVVKSAMAKLGGRPTIQTIQKIDKALYQAHNSPDGFKKHLIENPTKYGIEPDEQLKSFLARLNNSYITFLLTNSPEEYTRRMLDALEIGDSFDTVIPDAKKPASFSPNRSENKALVEKLNEAGIDNPRGVFYMGDHLYKDTVLAREFGFFTGLRMKRTDIMEVERKLEKYANVKFEGNGRIRMPVNVASQEALSNLNNGLAQIYRHVNVLTTKVQNLEPVLL